MVDRNDVDRETIMVEHLFTSSALCAIDDEMGLDLPLFVLATLSQYADPGALLIGGHENRLCLIGYHCGFANSLHADIERRRIAEEMIAPHLHHPRARRAFGFVQGAAVDARGRAVLPELMCRRARIGGQALLVGAGTTFELWDPETALDAGDADLRDLAAWHLEVKQAA
jgi:DNA-binding transcriptional regulator/RsmH inhibitor MraZ